MASLTQKQLQWYRDSIAAESLKAAKSVLSGLDPKTMDVATVRNNTIDAINNALSIYGNNAQVYASQLFDYIMQVEGNEKAVFDFAEDLIDKEMVEGKVKYYAQHIVEGDYKAYQKSISEYTQYLVKRTAHMSMKKNAIDNGIKYALVPTGNETCAFCFMLASRGFVYSDKTANK